MQVHEGGCLCGRVRFRSIAAPLDSGYCHCRMCQKNSGAPVVAYVEFPATTISWTGGVPNEYQSSVYGRRMFCAACGSFLAFRSEQDPSTIVINTASFDVPSAFPPAKHIFTDSRVGWFEIHDSLQRYPAGAR